MVTSGVRLGTPALTSRGMMESEMHEIGDIAVNAFAARGDEMALLKLSRRVDALCQAFPLYEGKPLMGLENATTPVSAQPHLEISPAPPPPAAT